MSKTLRAVALAAASVGALGLAAGAPTVAADASPTAAIPVGWSVLLDDTQTITLAVPGSWRETETVATLNDDGSLRPWVSATTEEAQFFPSPGTADPFSVPGAVYMAAPFEADTAAMVSSTVYDGVCTSEPAQPHDTGTFTGHLRSYTNCAGTGARVVVFVGHPADAAFTAILLVQVTGAPDDASTVEAVMRSAGRYVPPAT